MLRNGFRMHNAPAVLFIIIQNKILHEVQRIQSQKLDEWEQLNLTKLFPSF